MANTRSTIQIDLIATADTAAFTRITGGIDDVIEKARRMGDAFENASSTTFNKNAADSLEKIGRLFYSTADTAAELRHELDLLKSAGPDQLGLGDTKAAEERIDRLVTKLHELSAATDIENPGVLPEYLRSLTKINFDDLTGQLPNILAMLEGLQPPKALQTGIDNVQRAAEELYTYLDRAAGGAVRLEAIELDRLLQNLNRATDEASATAFSFDHLTDKIRYFAEFNNPKTADITKLFAGIDSDRIQGAADALRKAQDLAELLSGLLRDNETQLKYVRTNTGEIRDTAHDAGIAFKNVNSILEDLHQLSYQLATSLTDAMDPRVANKLTTAYGDLIDLLRRNKDAFALNTPDEAATKTIAAYRELVHILDLVGDEEAANTLGLSSDQIAGIRATAAYLDDARKSAGLMTAELRTVAQELELVEQKRLKGTTTTRSLLSRTEMADDEARKQEASLRMMQRLRAEAEGLEKTGAPLAVNEELTKLEVRAEAAGREVRETAELIMTTDERVRGIGDAYAGVEQAIDRINDSFDDGLASLGDVIEAEFDLGTAAHTAAEAQVAASRRATAAVDDQTAALRDFYEELLGRPPPPPPSTGPVAPGDPDELPHQSYERLIRYQQQLAREIYNTNDAAEAQQAAFAEIATRIKLQEANYKGATDGSLENIQKAAAVWAEVTAAAEKYGQAVVETLLATKLLDEPFADLAVQIEKARSAAVDYGDIAKLSIAAHKQDISLVAELVALEKQRGRIEGKLSGDEENLQNLTKQARILQDAIAAGKDETGALTKAFEQTQIAIAKASTKAAEIRQEVLGLVVALGNQSETLGVRLFDPTALQNYLGIMTQIDNKARELLNSQTLRTPPQGPGMGQMTTTPETAESLQRMARHIQDTGEAAAIASSDLLAYEAAMEDTRASVDKFLTTNEGAKQTLQDIGNALDRQKTYMSNAERTWDLLTSAIQEYNAMLDRLHQNPDVIDQDDLQHVAAMRNAIEGLILSVKDMGEEAHKLEGINLGEAIAKGNELAKAESELRAVNKAMEQTQHRVAALKKMGSSLSQMLFGSDLKTMLVTGTLLSFGREIENIFQGMAQNVKEWVETSNQQFDVFREKSIQLFAVMPGSSAMARDAVINDIMAIGTQYGYLTTETIPAAYKAMQLGVDEQNLFSTMATAAEAARVTGGDFTATLASGQNIINAYGGKIKDLNKVYDLLFYAQQNAGVSADGLTQALAPIIAVTGDLGVSLEDVISAMITMSRQGDDLESISSLLSNMFTQIQIGGTALGGVFEEAAKTDFRSFIAQGGTLIDAMRLIQEQAAKTGTSIPALVGGDSNFYRDQQAMISVLELTNQHLGELAGISSDVRQAQDLIADGYADIADEAFMANKQLAAQIEQMNIQAAKSWEPTRLAWAQWKAEAAQGIGGQFSLDDTNKQWEEFVAQLRSTADLQDRITAGKAQTLQQALMVGADEDSWWIGDDLNQLSVTWAGLTQQVTNAEQRGRQTAIMMKLLGDNSQATNRELVDASYLFYDLWKAYDAGNKPTDDMAAGLEKLRTKFPETYREMALALVTAGLLDESFLNMATGLKNWDREITAMPQIMKNWDREITPLPTKFYELNKAIRALDGDTIQALMQGANKPITIRLTNVDTPEIQHLDKDGNLTGVNQSYGQEARRFTENWLLEVESIKVSAADAQDDFGRQLRVLRGKLGQQTRFLQEDLIAAGLAIPLPIQITHDADTFNKQMELAVTAAEQGVGMFQNRLARAMFLEGSVDTTQGVTEIIELQRQYFPEGLQYARQLTEAQNALNDAQGEYVEGMRDNSAEIAQINAKLQADLTDTQKRALDKQLEQLDINSAEAIAIRKRLAADLTDKKRADLEGRLESLEAGQGASFATFTGDEEAAEEAAERIKDIQAEMKRDLEEHAYMRFFDTEGLTPEMGALAVALGVMTQTEAELAVAFAERKTALGQLPGAFEAVTFSAEEQARAIRLIIDGAVLTAEEAVARIQNLRDEASIFDSENFQNGGTFSTDVYWNMAGGRPEPNAPNQITFAPAMDEVAMAEFNAAIEEIGNANNPLYFTPTDDEAYTREAYKIDLQDFLNGDPVDAPVIADITPFQLESVAIQEFLDTQTYTAKVHLEFDNTATPGPGRDGSAAGGGHISAGNTFLVGEYGPELFVPYNSGRIIPNHQLRETNGNSNITVQIDARGNPNYNQIGRASRQGVLAAAKRMGIKTR